MDEQNKNESGLGSAAQGASTVVNLAKAAGKAATGNFVGAAKDVLLDPNLIKAIIAIIVGISLLVNAGLLIVGSSITGTVVTLMNNWQKNWDENWLEQNIKSNGSLVYLYTEGYDNAWNDTMNETLRSLFKLDHSVNEHDATNSSINGTTQFTGTSYEKTIQAIYDAEALASREGALMQRIDMIKNRVKQRGLQIRDYAMPQYSVEALGLALAEIFINQFQNPILYRGIESATVIFDMACFEFSDIQALKILAAYSIQKDCTLEDIDIYDLLDYCGWFGGSLAALDYPHLSGSNIYLGNVETTIMEEVGTVPPNTRIFDEYALKPPSVPAWAGTFAPQWYLEEIAQIKAHNDAYFAMDESKRGDMIPWGVENPDDALDLTAFQKLKNYQTFGIIDKIFMSSKAALDVSRSDYHGADEYFLEAMSAFAGTLVGDMWSRAFAAQEQIVSYGNRVGKNANGVHYFIFAYGSTGSTKARTVNPDGSITTYSYYVKNETSGGTSGRLSVSANGQSLTFSGLASNSTYTVWESIRTLAAPERPENPVTPNNAQFLPSPTAIGDSSRQVASFTTLAGNDGHQAYRLNMKLTVAFSARSMDDLASDLMGLWPGSLYDTEANEDGIEYASGHVDETLYAKTWNDTYTDPNGRRHTLSFSRQQGYQYETYLQLTEAMATILGIDTTGLYEPQHNPGDDIVEIARREYEYYTANSLYEGARYWLMIDEVLGWTCPLDAAWCVAFVLCCAHLGGYIGEDAVFGPNWTFYVSGAFQDFINAGQCEAYTYPNDKDYRPVPGDIIFFSYPPELGGFMTHIGIVEYVDDEDQLHIIHGNSNNKVQKTSFEHYQVGTIRDKNSGEFIYGYIHPYYPTSDANQPQYLSVSGLTQAVSTSRYVTAGTSNVLLSGITRLRPSQLPEFIAALKQSYPTIYSTALQSALDSNNVDAFITAWNSIANSSQGNSFATAQLHLSKKLFYQPLAKRVLESSGFNWTATKLREEIFLSIVTTTDQYSALERMLAELTTGLDPKIKDDDFSTALRTGRLLVKTLDKYKANLWPGENAALQNSWISGIGTLLAQLSFHTSSPGSLSGEYFIDLDTIDPAYEGHAVPQLTPYQISQIKNTIYGEGGSNLEACIIVAQSIRDNVDRTGISYDDFVETFQYVGGYTERDPSVYETETVNAAFDYVFLQGGSAFQHPVYCYYAPSATLTCDADFQALFQVPLSFVYQSGKLRCFSWDD